MMAALAAFVFVTAVLAVRHSKWWVVAAYLAVAAAWLIGQGEPTRWVRSEDARVLSATEDRGVAIYVLVQYPDDRQPVYVQIPWSKGASDSLAAAQSAAGKHGKVTLKGRATAQLPTNAPQGQFEGEDYTPPPKD